MKTLYYNGTLVTMDSSIEEPGGQIKNGWVLVENDRIVDIGIEDDMPEGIERNIDLLEKTLIPGLFNSHIHMLPTGMGTKSIFIFDCVTFDDVLERVTGQLGRYESNDCLVMVEGFNSAAIDYDQTRDLKKLDAISGDHPIYLKYNTGHGGILNSKLMDKLNKTVSVDVVEETMGQVQNLFTDLEVSEFIVESCNESASFGVTTVNAFIYGDLDDNRDIDVWISNELASRSLPIHTVNFMQTTNVELAKSKGLSRIGGCIALDGTPVEMTAAFEEPYLDQSGKPSGFSGDLYMSDDAVYQMIYEAHKNDMQCTFHAVGDKAVHQAIRCYEKVIHELGPKNLRHRIEHVDLVSEDMLKKAVDLGIIFSVQPSLLHLFGANFEGILGQERNDQMGSLQTYKNAGMMLIGGTDSPVTPPNPLLGLHGAVNQETENRRLSVYEALKMFTLDAAFGVHQEKEKGSLEKGKIADLVVLSANPFESPGAIDQIKVLRTVVAGTTVYQV